MATATINGININEQVSPLFRDLLYFDTIWQPGLTFEEQTIQPGAGVFYVNKITKGAIDPALPGSDFSSTEDGTEQIAVLVNNTFQKDEKVRKVTASQLFNNSTLLDNKVEYVMELVRESWQISATAKVQAEVRGTTGSVFKNINADSQTAEAVSADNVKDMFIAYRTNLKVKKVSADFAIVSPQVYGAMLSFSGREFTPNTNENTLRTGFMGTFMGIRVFEANIFAEAAAKYIDDAGATQTVDLTDIDLLMGNHKDIAMGNTCEEFRIKDSENFVGSRVQAEVLAGFKVKDPERMLLKLNQ